ncbi:MAG: YdeI/OmpD-associated family protein [Clostridiales bacterium]|nr:YdeI/OmpD-associated family protein [Clostridiales bacterium]
MKENIPELLFPTREDFRGWLYENAQTSEGVWLVFGKSKEIKTLTATEALEEALCYGWIDGQMKSIDGTKYLKYFARRRAKSPWSDKNKKIVEMLREKKLITELGEKAVDEAIKNGMWNAPKAEPVTDEQVEAFALKLENISPAYENFLNMPKSVRVTYTKRYLSFKNEESRQKDFEKIADRLNKNLKPM